ncbi:hypothetical protein CLOM_g3717, partial [Closterium sp. NIES-68]
LPPPTFFASYRLSLPPPDFL